MAACILVVTARTSSTSSCPAGDAAKRERDGAHAGAPGYGVEDTAFVTLDSARRWPLSPDVGGGHREVAFVSGEHGEIIGNDQRISW